MASYPQAVMELGVIAPIKFLEKYCTLTRFQYCYATLILESEEYRSFYKGRQAAGDIIILDYSPDLPRRASLEEYLEAAELITPTVVVLPSLDFQLSKTVYLVREFLDSYPGKAKFVGVIQGTTLKELKECYKALRKLCDIIGLPSTNELIMKREWIIKKLKIQEPTLYIEVHSDPIEEIPVTENVIGICTSFPLRLAYERRDLREIVPTPPLLNFCAEEDSKLGMLNLEDYMEVLEG